MSWCLGILSSRKRICSLRRERSLRRSGHLFWKSAKMLNPVMFIQNKKNIDSSPETFYTPNTACIWVKPESGWYLNDFVLICLPSLHLLSWGPFSFCDRLFMEVCIVTLPYILFRSSTKGFWRASKLPHFGTKVLFVMMEGKTFSEAFLVISPGFTKHSLFTWTRVASNEMLLRCLFWHA